MTYRPGPWQDNSLPATLPIATAPQFTLVNGVSCSSYGTEFAFYRGLFDPVSSCNIVPTGCRGASCTWPNYYTLGFCISCTNVTDQAQPDQDRLKWTLPHCIRVDARAVRNGMRLLRSYVTSSAPDMLDIGSHCFLTGSNDLRYAFSMDVTALAL